MERRRQGVFRVRMRYLLVARVYAAASSPRPGRPLLWNFTAGRSPFVSVLLRTRFMWGRFHQRRAGCLWLTWLPGMIPTHGTNERCRALWYLE